MMKYWFSILFVVYLSSLQGQDYIKFDFRDTNNFFTYKSQEINLGQKLIIYQKPPICTSFMVIEDPLTWYDFDSLFNFMANHKDWGFKVNFHNSPAIEGYSKSSAVKKLCQSATDLQAETFIRNLSDKGFGNIGTITSGKGDTEPLFEYENFANDSVIEKEIWLHKIEYNTRCEVEIIPKEETLFDYDDSTFLIGQEKRIEIKRDYCSPYIISTMNNSVIDSLYQFLEKNIEVEISIIEHTDTRGSLSANQKLSNDRAKAFKAELIRRGIAAERLEAIGKGESEPLYSENFVNQFKKSNPKKHEQLHYYNRRTIIRIIGFQDL